MDSQTTNIRHTTTNNIHYIYLMDVSIFHTCWFLTQVTVFHNVLYKRNNSLYRLGPSSKQNVRVSWASSSKNSVVNESHHRLSLSWNYICLLEQAHLKTAKPGKICILCASVCMCVRAHARMWRWHNLMAAMYFDNRHRESWDHCVIQNRMFESHLEHQLALQNPIQDSCYILIIHKK